MNFDSALRQRAEFEYPLPYAVPRRRVCGYGRPAEFLPSAATTIAALGHSCASLVSESLGHSNGGGSGAGSGKQFADGRLAGRPGLR